MKKVIVLGSSGNTPDLLDIIRQTEGVTCVGILDDNEALHGQKVYETEVLGNIESARNHVDCFFVNGIYSIPTRLIRKDILAKTGISPDRFISLVHPSAVVSPSASIGRGSAILANVTVCANATIKEHCVVLPNSVINHDVVLEDCATVASSVGLSGGVRVGKNSYVGSGALVREHLTIGEGAIVAMGAVVVYDVPPHATVMGCPAKPLVTSDQDASF